MKNSNMLLDFVIIGSQKCATTWLYDCLKDHPQLNLRDSKNEDAYYGGKMFKDNGGEDWYFGQFKNGKEGQFRGCVSVEYIEDVDAPANLFNLNPGIKIIESLRNPSERAVSAYQWYVRKAYIPNLPLEKGIQAVISHYNGEQSNEYTANYKNIIERGFYAQKLKRFLDKFDVSQIQLILFEDTKKSPLNSYQNVCNFLNIDPSFVPPNLNTIPKKNTGFGPLVRLQRTFPKSKIVGKLTDITNQVLFKKLATKAPAEKVSPETMLQLQKIFEPSIAELIELAGKIDKNVQEKLAKNWVK